MTVAVVDPFVGPRPFLFLTYRAIDLDFVLHLIAEQNAMPNGYRLRVV